MRRIKKGISALILAFTMFLGMSVTASADSTVVYNGRPDEFTGPTDLFGNFKDVMPGDTLTERITLRNNAASRADVRFHLLVTGAAEEESQKFLQQLTLSITQENGPQIFSGQASEGRNEVDLGRYTYGGSTTLVLTLEVPLTLGNEFQEAAGHIGWRLRAEEYDDVAAPGGGGGEPAVTAAPVVTALFPGGTAQPPAGEEGAGLTEMEGDDVPLARGNEEALSDENIDGGDMPLGGPGEAGHRCCILHFLLCLIALGMEIYYTHCRKQEQLRRLRAR